MLKISRATQKLLLNLLLACNIIMLNGCMVGPNYVPPTIEPPTKFVSQNVIQEINQDKKNTLLINWWDGFDDQLLNSLVDSGIENNYEIARAVSLYNFAKAQLIIAEAGYNLNGIGTIDGGVELEKSLKPGTTDNQRNVFGGLNLTQPFDIFGKVARRVQAANAEIEEARNNLKAALLRVSANIVRQYLDLRGKQQQLEVLFNSIRIEIRTRDIVKSRYKSGLAPELDLTRSEAAVALLQASVPRLQESLLNSRNKLAELTGQFPGIYEQLLTPVQNIPEYQNRIPNVFPLQVLMVRPDVLRAQAAVKRTIARVGVAEADFYPTLELQGLVSVGTISSNIASTLDLLIATLNGLLQQVVIDNGVLKGNLAAANALSQQALADYRQILLTASQEVETTLAALDASRKSQVSLEVAVKNSQYSFRKAEAVYQQGLLSFLDVLDAQRVLVNAEQQLALERTNYATNIANLFLVLGANVSVPESIIDKQLR